MPKKKTCADQPADPSINSGQGPSTDSTSSPQASSRLRQGFGGQAGQALSTDSTSSPQVNSRLRPSGLPPALRFGGQGGEQAGLGADGAPAYRVMLSDITELKRAEELIEEERNLLRSIIDAIPDEIVVKDLERKFVLANEGCLRALGKQTLDQVMGFRDEDLISERFARDSREKEIHVLTSGETLFNDIPEPRRNPNTGELERVIMSTKTPLHDRSGRTIGLVTVNRNVTELQRAQESLRQSENRFRTVWNNSLDAMRLTDADGNIVMVNPSYCRLFKKVSEELVGRSLVDTYLPKPDENIVGDYCERFRNRTIEPFLEAEITIWNGEELFLELSNTFLSLPDQPELLLSVFRDISERTRAEDALRESEGQYRTIVENIGEGIGFVNSEERFAYANRAAEEIFGVGPGGLVGIGLDQLVSPEQYKLVQKESAQRAQGHKSVYELEIARPNGEKRNIIVTAVPQNNKGIGFVGTYGVFRDITERKRAEEALRYAQKTQSIGTLAGGIAHDFNNLLNAVLGQSALALGKLPKESPAGDNVAKAMKAAERAADLTRQLLAYSGRGKFLVEEVDLNLFVKENVQMLEVSIPKTTKLRFELGSPSPHIKADMGQLQQVVMNLIINAGEATGHDPGYIFVRTSGIKLSEDDTEYWKYTTTPLQPGWYALLQVSDNGHGMKPEVLARIFDPFFTTKFTGRGLGLAAVLGIIRGHHGGVLITSEEGKGTRFDVVFPIVEASTTADAEQTKKAVVVDGEGKTVLVIDDEPSVLELLTDIFTEAKFWVIGALNPMEGIELYRRNQQSIAMVVLDYSMPDMDGKAAFEELVKINKDVKVLLCSGYMEEEMESAFGTLRPAGFIHKPYQPTALLQRMSRVLSDQWS